MRRSSFLGNLILPFVIYSMLSRISVSLANFVLCVVIIAVVIYLLGMPVYAETAYKKAIKYVDKRFVFNDYTIRNDVCSVHYTPDEKIVVMDNAGVNRGRDLRTFTVSKSADKHINKTWSQICKIFDDYSSVDSLAAFVGLYVDVNIVLIPTTTRKQEKSKKQNNSIKIDASNVGPRFVEMNDIVPDPYSKDTGQARKTADNFVNLDNVKKLEPVVERVQTDSSLADLGDALSVGPNKINVNIATAAELSILPGINIVMAKKIVKFRDTTRMFESVDDFVVNSGVKSHFESKIKSMIIAEKPSVKKSNDDNDEGRIVDI